MYDGRLSDDELEDVAGYHFSGDGRCVECRHMWPCPTTLLCRHIRSLEEERSDQAAELAALREAGYRVTAINPILPNDHFVDDTCRFCGMSSLTYQPVQHAEDCPWVLLKSALAATTSSRVEGGEGDHWHETTSGGNRTCDDCQRTIMMGELWYCWDNQKPGVAIWHRCTNCWSERGRSFKWDAVKEPANDDR